MLALMRKYQTDVRKSLTKGGSSVGCYFQIKLRTEAFIDYDNNRKHSIKNALHVGM